MVPSDWRTRSRRDGCGRNSSRRTRSQTLCRVARDTSGPLHSAQNSPPSLSHPRGYGLFHHPAPARDLYIPPHMFPPRANASLSPRRCDHVQSPPADFGPQVPTPLIHFWDKRRRQRRSQRASQGGRMRQSRLRWSSWIAGGDMRLGFEQCRFWVSGRRQVVSLLSGGGVRPKSRGETRCPRPGGRNRGAAGGPEVAVRPERAARPPRRPR